MFLWLQEIVSKNIGMKPVLFFTLFVMLMSACSDRDKQSTYVSIATDKGEIVVKLYNDTPAHRDNFIKLAEAGFYDDLLFHRVIEDFMIQGGDPESRNAAPDAGLGSGGPGYTIPAEIVPTHYHKKGALAAARQSDNVNPRKESSGSQFYIVTGNVFTEGQLAALARQMMQYKEQQLFNALASERRSEIMQMRRDKDQAGLAALQEELVAQVKAQMPKSATEFFSEEQRQTYTTVGGAPHLDGEYTVFGEVVEGFDVLDKIQAVATRAGDRPEKDIKMRVKVLQLGDRSK